MAELKYVVRTLILSDYATEYMGVSRDTFLNQESKNTNYGDWTYLYCKFVDYSGTGNREYRPLLEIVMPDKKDVDGLDEVIKVELLLTSGTPSVPVGCAYVNVTLALIEVDDVWEERTAGSLGYYSTWDHPRELIEWTQQYDGGGAAASKNKDDGGLDDSDNLVAIFGCQLHELSTPPAVNCVFNLRKTLDLGDTKSYVVVGIDSDAAVGDDDSYFIPFFSRTWFEVNNRPKVRIIYKDYSPDAFNDEQSALKISPNPDNPEQPMLEWGGVKDADFKQFKLFRQQNTPITSVTGLTPIYTTTSPADGKYIDTATLVVGGLYYYMVTAEDAANVDNGASFSKNVEFYHQAVNSAAILPPGAHPVGTLMTLNWASSAQYPLKRVWVDWGDGIQSWYTIDPTTSVGTIDHMYASSISGMSPSVRFENFLGFWSNIQSLASTTSEDATPYAKLFVRPQQFVDGEVLRFNASLSQPIASNAIISTYEFYVDGAYRPPQASPIFDYAPTTGTQNVKVRIVTSTGKMSISPEVTIHETTITPLFLNQELSKNTVIRSRQTGRSMVISSSPYIDGDGEFETLDGYEKQIISFDCMTRLDTMKDDLDVIDECVMFDRYVKVEISDEKDGEVTTYFGRITSYSITKDSERMAQYSFDMTVFEKQTDNVECRVTAITSGGVGFTQIAYADSTLDIQQGDFIEIYATQHYNGVYKVEIRVDATHFKIQKAYNWNDMGSPWFAKPFVRIVSRVDDTPWV